MRRVTARMAFASAEAETRCLVTRLGSELDALDVEKLLPVGLIPDDFGQHPLSLSPSSEELDHLLDLGANDSPDNMWRFQPSRVRRAVRLA